MQATDICKSPICGVCDWDGKTAAQNIVDGKEAAWALKRLNDDLYLVMNRADKRGLRCLGFITPDAPYPSLITWSEKPVTDSNGECYKLDDAGAVTTTVMRDEKTKEALTCDAKKKCAKGSKCVYSQSMVGSWSMDLKGGEDPANWFCGFQNFGAAAAASGARSASSTASSRSAPSSRATRTRT